MAEGKESKEAEAPKKGKLPVIAAVVLVVLAGGFFFFKGGGEKAEEPEIKLGHAEEVGEFLVNLNDGVSYLSTKVTVHMADGETIIHGDGHGGGGPDPAVMDAVIQVLTSKSLDEVTSVDGKKRLKQELAYAMNHAIHASHGDEGDDKKKKKEEDEDKEEEESHGDDHHGLPKDFKPENPDWDSDEGPVLKVYFTSFTTQR